MQHQSPIAILWAFIFFLALTVFASQATLPSATDHLPSITQLAQLSFTPIASTSDLPYSEVSTARGLFLAYDAGLSALAKYRDPALTRGASGIAVFKAVAPAVVVVVVGSVKNHEFDPEGMGTGAIVDGRGYVLTNWHVVGDHTAAVVFVKPTTSSDIGNAKSYIARVIYEDPTVDLAILKMIDPPSILPTVAVGEIENAQVAEDIHVIGHPHGNLWSYSTGVISQIRSDYKWSYEDGSRHEAKVLQLQTAINPGNSGGPVVDDGGRLLGLVAMTEEGQNIDYAIAVDVIKRFLFVGMRMATRGGGSSMTRSHPPQQIYISKTGDGLEVIKAIYSDAIVYSIKGKVNGLVAKFNDGTEVDAWNKDPNDNFDSWSATSPDGRKYVGAASKGSLVQISKLSN